MRTYFLGVPVVAFLAALPTSAYAQSACTEWIHFSGTQDSCLEMVDDLTKKARLKSRRTGATFFFWFGNNVVTTRCIAEKGLISFAAYHRRNDACKLAVVIIDVIEQGAPPSVTARQTDMGLPRRSGLDASNRPR